ncbi:MAG: type II secretion system minor pseudopilin GspJ [Magnetococcales bacterium]|nr:type II secretion system minor pseudopilin GspJ [Magnetococcales bacterium]
MPSPSPLRSSRRPRPSRPPAGFTLVEMLVALAVFSVLALMVHGGLSSILQTRDVVTEQSRKLQRWQTTFAILQRDLMQATARPIRAPSGAYMAPFMGGGEGPMLLEMTCLREALGAGVGLASPPLERVTYTFHEGVISRLVWPVVDRASATTPIPQTLLTDVEEVKLRFVDFNLNWSLAFLSPAPPILGLPPPKPPVEAGDEESAAAPTPDAAFGLDAGQPPATAASTAFWSAFGAATASGGAGGLSGSGGIVALQPLAAWSLQALPRGVEITLRHKGGEPVTRLFRVSG